MLENRSFIYDGNLVATAATTKTASYSGVSYIDTGGGFTAGKCVVNVTAATNSSTDQLYRMIVQGSPDATFGTAGNVVDLAEQRCGVGEVLAAATASKDQGAAVYEFPFTNQFGDTVYRYLRFRMVISGGGVKSITYTSVISCN